MLAGRGFGKTRIGAEWVNGVAERHKTSRIALVGATAADVRDVMVGGESGILAKARPDMRPRYEPSKRLLTWPTGAIAHTYSAEEPDRLRGPQHSHAWADELAAWQYPEEAFDTGLMMGLRLGEHPRVVVTTTPRPLPIVTSLLGNPACVVTRGSTYDNRGNLPPAFFSQILRKYEGTRLARQEIFGEVLADFPGALWQRAIIDAARVRVAPELKAIVIAVDPATTSGENSDETGIVIAGVDEEGDGYVLADRSGRYTPHEWASLVVALYDEWKADRIIVETNQGGDLVESNLRSVRQHMHIVRVHARRSKRLRAEPVGSLYEQRRVHHVGMLAKLEDQMVNWEPDAPGDSPDRVDALVYALTDLMIDNDAKAKAIVPRAFPGRFRVTGGGMGGDAGGFQW